MSFVGILFTWMCSDYRGWLHGAVWLSVVLLFVGTILGLVGFKDLAVHENHTGTDYAGEVGPGVCSICAAETGPFFLVNCQIGIKIQSLLVKLLFNFVHLFDRP